jgi:hypothetical protein
MHRKYFYLLLHMKLRLTKNSVKVINRNGEGSGYHTLKFPWISDAKIREFLWSSGKGGYK